LKINEGMLSEITELKN